MKKSEMISVIADYLKLREETPIVHDADEAAEYIIGCCETWGMLPPISKDIPPEDNDYISWAVEEFYNWKPEDEPFLSVEQVRQSLDEMDKDL